MNSLINKIEKILIKEFSKKRKVYLAVSNNDIPSVRSIHIYYHNRSVYLLTLNEEVLSLLNNNAQITLNASSSLHNLAGVIEESNYKLNSKELDLLYPVYKEIYFEDKFSTKSHTRIAKINILSGYTFNSKDAFSFDFKTNEVIVTGKKKVTI